MTMDEVLALLTSLEGVEVDVPGPGSEAPEIAWGDAFATYDPDHRGGQGFPFITVVTKDYPGFDEASDLNRPAVFRLNLWVGRDVIASRTTPDADPAALDTWIPHPVYTPQGWSAIERHPRAGRRARRRDDRDRPHRREVTLPPRLTEG